MVCMLFHTSLLDAELYVLYTGSTFHVVEYNSTTGVVIRRRTSQGYADNSTWSRGQSWAIYGFANSERHVSIMSVNVVT
jgi:hypothetical protein